MLRPQCLATAKSARMTDTLLPLVPKCLGVLTFLWLVINSRDLGQVS